MTDHTTFNCAFDGCGERLGLNKPEPDIHYLLKMEAPALQSEGFGSFTSNPQLHRNMNTS